MPPCSSSRPCTARAATGCWATAAAHKDSTASKRIARTRNVMGSTVPRGSSLANLREPAMLQSQRPPRSTRLLSLAACRRQLLFSPAASTPSGEDNPYRSAKCRALRARLLRRAVDILHALEQLQRFGHRALECVATHDRAERAAVRETLDLGQHLGGALRLTAREDHDAATAEGALHDVTRAIRERADRDLLRLVDFLRGLLLDLLGRRLDLDDVRAELSCDLGRVGADVDRGLALLAQRAAARIAPHDDRETGRLRLFGDRAQLHVHRVALVAARIDREADRGATEAQRVVDRTRDRGLRVRSAVQRVAVVQLQDQRDAARVLARTAFEETERRCIRVAAGGDRELEMIVRVVTRRVLRERTRGTVLEALVDRQDHELAGAGERAGFHDPAQVLQDAWVVGFVPAEDFVDALAHVSRRGRAMVPAGEG